MQSTSTVFWRNSSAPPTLLQRPRNIDVQRVDGMARGHEQAAARASAEADVGASFRQRNAPDRGRIGGKHHDAVEGGIAHTPAAPQIAVGIAAYAVRGSAPGVEEKAAIGDSAAAVDHVIDADFAIGDAARLHDIEQPPVRREGEAVGPEHIVGHDRRCPGRRIEPVDVLAEFRLGLVAFVIAEDAEDRIGEPDRIICRDHDVVRRIQALALEAVHQDRDGAVIFRARDPAPAVLAGHEPSLAVARVAIGEIRRLPVDADGAGLFLPLHDPVVGNVAPQEIAAVAEPHRALGPATSRRQTLDGGEFQPIGLETRVERDDGGVGIACGRFPAIGKLWRGVLCCHPCFLGMWVDW